MGDGKILVVDDNPANIQLLSRLLETHGYEVQTADCGQLALEVERRFQPEMILLDIDLPDLDGYAVAKALDQHQDLMVIFISALSDLEQIVRGFDVGGLDYITKPFMPREVLARIDRHFAYRRQQHEMRNLLQRENQRVANVNHLRQQFVYSATHDLKNPLNQIMGFTDVLRSDPRLGDADLQSYLGYMQTSAEKMRILVEDMLDVAQLESLGLRRERVSLNQLAEQALRAALLSAQERQIHLHWEAEEQINFEVDAERISRVLENLISNAVKYTPIGGQVTVSVASTAQFAILRVQDTGIGIAETDIPHLFEAFYRIRRPETEHITGSGLGLFIVKTILDQHGGKIEVESQEGRGSTFTVWLPL